MIHSLSLPVTSCKTGRKSSFLEWWTSNIFARFNKMHFIIFIFTQKSIQERIQTVFGFLCAQWIDSQIKDIPKRTNISILYDHWWVKFSSLKIIAKCSSLIKRFHIKRTYQMSAWWILGQDSWLTSKFWIFGGSYKSFVITLENQFFCCHEYSGRKIYFYPITL